MERVIILDVDGPMIPGRQYETKLGIKRRNKRGEMIGYRFDPFSVHLVTHLARTANAAIVWNTMHNQRGLSAITEDARASGLDETLFHETCPQTCYPAPLEPWKMSQGIIPGMTRISAITTWLTMHPKVTHWVALDDELIKHKNAILVDFEGGLTSGHIDRAMEILEVQAERLVVEVPERRASV